MAKDPRLSPPDTISDADYRHLQDRAHRANPTSITDPKAIKQRLASQQQRRQRKSS